jgi:hypothetical protein
MRPGFVRLWHNFEQVDYPVCSLYQMIRRRDALHLRLDLLLRPDLVALFRKSVELPVKLVKRGPVLQASGAPGVDGMITIFGKNWRFSQKPVLWSNFCII